MPRSVALVACALLVVTCVALPTASVARAAPSPNASFDPALLPLWPLPTSITHGDTDAPVADSSTFMFTLAPGTANTTLLNGAIERYKALIFSSSIRYGRGSATAGGAATLTGLVVKVVSTNETLGLDTDESYTLTVAAPSASLTADTVFGAMRGLETFSQLITKTRGTGGALHVPATPWNISDKPAYQHRGLLIDSSRHFLPLPSVLSTIDALAFSRMNVLHWHIVDSQSFPLESKTYPNLTAAGAYDADSVYTHEDVATVVQHGLERGVRVIIELDSPGHTYAWGLGYEEQGLTVCGAAEPWGTYCAEPPCGQLDPTNDFTYELVKGLWTEVAGLMTDEYVHIGGDEVNAACWGANATHAATLMDTYVKKLQGFVAATGKQMIQWQGSFDVGAFPAANTVIELWKPESFRDVLKAGYRMVLAPYTYWYLDCGGGNWITGGTSWCAPFKSWQDIYGYTMAPESGPPLTPAERALILGGEVAIWGEMVDETVLLQRAWPRSAAAGERMWTDPDSSATWQLALPRLRSHRARLVARGIPAEPLQPTYCSQELGNCPWPA